MASALWKIKPQLEAPAAGMWLGPGASSGKDGVWIGTLAELGPLKLPRVWLSTTKEQVVAVVGKRGSGKSYTLGVIAEGLCLSEAAPIVAKQSRRRATLLFDPLDVYWTTRFPVSPSNNEEAQRHFDLAEEAGLSNLGFNVEAWVPGVANRRGSDPAWFNTLQLAVPLLGLEEWELLLEINAISEPMGHALTDALGLVAESGYRKGGRNVPPTPAFSMAALIDAVTSDDLAGNYHAETLRALRQRLGSLDATGLFDAQGTPISALLAPGRLTVILLNRLPQSYRSALVAVLTRMLVDNRSAATFAEKRLALDPTLNAAERAELERAVVMGVPRTVVALDEAQTFLAPGAGGPAKEVFVRLVKEGRNIGLSAVVATQQPSAVDQRVLSQVETFISHQLVTEPDIKAVRDNLKSGLPDSIEFGKNSMDAAGLLRTLAPGQCLVSSADMNTAIRRCAIMAVRPRATVHGGIEL